MALYYLDSIRIPYAGECGHRKPVFWNILRSAQFNVFLGRGEFQLGFIKKISFMSLFIFARDEWHFSLVSPIFYDHRVIIEWWNRIIQTTNNDE